MSYAHVIFTSGYFYIKDPTTGEVIKSESTSDNAIMEMPKNCRWLDPGRHLQWFGDMLVNDEGKFLTAVPVNEYVGKQFHVMFLQTFEPVHLTLGEFIPKNDNEITTIPTWGPEYVVSMELFVDSWGPASSILLFRALDGDCCEVGHRVPAIWANTPDIQLLHTGTDQRTTSPHSLHVGTNIGTDPNHWVNVDVGDERRWFTLTISQKLKNVSFLLKVV